MKARARYIIVALIAAGLLAVMRGHDGILGASPQILSPLASSHGTPRAPELATRTQALPAHPSAELSARSLASDASRKLPQTVDGEVSVGLSAESNPNVGDVFQLELNTESRRSVGRYTVTVNYDPLMLRLVGVRSSEFVVRPTDIANFTARTPPNVEGQLVVSWDGRSIIGKGVLGHVEFELYAGGSTEIALSDIEVVDTDGGAVAVPIPEPVRVERHLS